MSKKHEIDIDKLLQNVAQGISLRESADEFGVPKSTLCDHLLKPESIERYDMALQTRTILHVDQMFEEMKKLIDGKPTQIDIAVFREIKDCIKWTAGKEMSHRYGDKHQLDVKVQNINDLLNELPDE